MTTMVKAFPTLYGRSSTGKIKVWKIEVKEKGNEYHITSTHGYEGMKMAVSKPVIVTKGKNIGKKNETSPKEQAIFDAQSKWDKKNKTGYETSKSLLKQTQLILPMLAYKFQDRKHNVTFPKVALQPKLNGVRCVGNINKGDVVLYSRLGNAFNNLDHIENELGSLITCDAPNFYFDGELYAHGEPLEKIVAMCKKDKKPTKEELKIIEKLEYHIYDCFDITSEETMNTGFEERYKTLQKLFGKKKYKNLELVKTHFNIKDEASVLKHHKSYVAKKYEGVMVRNSEASYKLNNRSKDLLKYKEFLDTECIITGFHDGKGREKGAVVWECRMPDSDNVFSVRPQGSMDDRKKAFKTADKQIGKLLTVQYAEMTSDGIPRHGVGLVIRDYE